MAKRKKEAEASEQTEAKEHKKNWRETRASAEDIQNFLCDNILLRHNVISGEAEFRRCPRVDISHGRQPARRVALGHQVAERERPAGELAVEHAVDAEGRVRQGDMARHQVGLRAAV